MEFVLLNIGLGLCAFCMYMLNKRIQNLTEHIKTLYRALGETQMELSKLTTRGLQ